MVSLLEFGGLKPIRPFLRGRSDAACRVVIKNVGFLGGGAGGMWRGWAGESSRCEDPAPTVGVCGDAIACRIAIQMPPFPPPPCAYHAAHGNPRFYNRCGMGRAGTRGGPATFGPPLQHRPYQGRNSLSLQLIEIFTTTRHAASLRTSRNGIA